MKATLNIVKTDSIDAAIAIDANLDQAIYVFPMNSSIKDESGMVCITYPTSSEVVHSFWWPDGTLRNYNQPEAESDNEFKEFANSDILREFMDSEPNLFPEQP